MVLPVHDARGRVQCSLPFEPSPKFHLRADQRELIERVEKEYRDGFRTVLAQAATGFGKTFTVVSVIVKEVDAGRRVLFVAHLDAIVEDTVERLRANGVRVGLI